MRFFNIKKQLKWVRMCILVSPLFLANCAFFPWEHPKVNQNTPEERVREAEAQFNKMPDSIRMQKNLHVTKESAVYELMALAEQARLKGSYPEARQFYERVLSFAPNNQSAITGIADLEREVKHNIKLEQASELIEKDQVEKAKREVHDVLLESPKNAHAQGLKDTIDEKVGLSKPEAIKLKSNIDKPISLELRDANVKFAFEALSRSTGINFILDKDIRPDTKINIFVRNMPTENAIEIILSSNGFQKKVLSENTVFVFSNTQQKRKDYQDLRIRSFYLNNTSAKEVSNLFKSILKAKDIYIDERLNILVLRDSPEVINLAEKLVSVVDVADSEVMLDIEVLEVSRSRLQELGIVYPNQLAVIGADTGLTLKALKNITSSTIGVSPNPALNFKKTTGDVNLLSNPRIRVKNNEKAKILVGDKVPIITTTSTANVGVSENVTYVDVGLKLEVEPKINLENFVSIKVGLEVSSLGDKTVTKNGATVYTIGTRNANTLLRLKDGETQILAGLILDDERKNASRLPGLGDIPLIGRLFSNQEDKKSKTEIVLAITPRVLSNLQLPKSDAFDFWSGTDSQILDAPQKFSAPNSSGNASPVLESLSPIERLQEQKQERQIEVPSEIQSQENNIQLQSIQQSQQIQSSPIRGVDISPETNPENLRKSDGFMHEIDNTPYAK